jgi:hypothetical protein
MNPPARASLLGLAVALGSSAWPLAQGGSRAAAKPKSAAVRLIPFEGSLEAARAEARERAAPILALAFYEGQDWNPKDHWDIEGLRDEVLGSKELAELAPRAVVVLANDQPHELVDRPAPEAADPSAAKQRECPRYRTSNCAQHQRLFDELYRAYNEDGAFANPTIVVLAPGGEQRARFASANMPPLGKVLEALKTELARGPSPLTREEKTQLDACLVRARAALAAKQCGPAWREALAAVELARASPLAKQATELVGAARSSWDQTRMAIQAQVEQGAALEAWRTLTRLLPELDGTPGKDEAAKLLRQLEQSPEHKPAVAQAKLELQAAQLLAAIRELERQNAMAKAKPKLRELWKRFPLTPAAQEAAAAWPALYAELSGK